MSTAYSGRVGVGFAGGGLSESLRLLAYAKDALALPMEASDAIPPRLRNLDGRRPSPERIRQQYLGDSVNLDTLGRQWLALWTYEVDLDSQMATVTSDKTVDMRARRERISHLLGESIAGRAVMGTKNAISQQDLASGEFRQFAEIIMLLRALSQSEWWYRSWEASRDPTLSRPPTQQEGRDIRKGLGIDDFPHRVFDLLRERVQDLLPSSVTFNLRFVPSEHSWIWHHGLYVMVTEGLGDEALHDAGTMDAVVQFLFDIIA